MEAWDPPKWLTLDNLIEYATQVRHHQQTVTVGTKTETRVKSSTKTIGSKPSSRDSNSSNGSLAEVQCEDDQEECSQRKKVLVDPHRFFRLVGEPERGGRSNTFAKRTASRGTTLSCLFGDSSNKKWTPVRHSHSA